MSFMGLCKSFIKLTKSYEMNSVMLCLFYPTLWNGCIRSASLAIIYTISTRWINQIIFSIYVMQVESGKLMMAARSHLIYEWWNCVVHSTKVHRVKNSAIVIHVANSVTLFGNELRNYRNTAEMAELFFECYYKCHPLPQLSLYLFLNCFKGGLFII